MVNCEKGGIMLNSFLLGLTSLVVLFFVCLVFVVGVKSVFLRYFYKPKPKTIVKPKPKKRIKTLTINPDEVDRIYVKKAS